MLDSRIRQEDQDDDDVDNDDEEEDGAKAFAPPNTVVLKIPVEQRRRELASNE